MTTYTPEQTLAWVLEEMRQLTKRAERQYRDLMNTTSRYYGEDHYIMNAITADVEKCEDIVHDMLKIANEIKMRTREVKK